MTDETLLTAYLRVLEARAWVELPTSEMGTSIFTRGTYLLDRIHLVGGRWSHHHYDGRSWPVKARGNDVASLEKYLAQHFRSDRR